MTLQIYIDLCICSRIKKIQINCKEWTLKHAFDVCSLVWSLKFFDTFCLKRNHGKVYFSFVFSLYWNLQNQKKLIFLAGVHLFTLFSGFFFCLIGFDKESIEFVGSRRDFILSKTNFCLIFWRPFEINDSREKWWIKLLTI